MRGGWIPTAAALLVVVACGANEPLPDPRAATERAARRLEAASPEAAQRLRALAAEAAFLAEDRGRAAAWGPVLMAARAAIVEQHLRRQDLAEQWRQLEPRVEAAVERAWRQSAGPGLERREARWAQQAAAALETARRLAAAGQLGGALEAGREALDRARQVDATWQALHARFREPRLRRVWRSWAETTIAATRHGPPALLIDKLERRLDVYSGGRRVASFPVELGSRGLERKLHAGDRATPEGTYRVVQVKSGAQTRYYKALLLDYPNGEDLARYREGRRRGEVPRHAGAGGLIEIHGHGGQGRDWTDGCVALTDADMDALFRHVHKGTRVTIVGTLAGA